MNEIIHRAITFAARAHEGQERKHTGEPYIVHPLAVLATLRARPWPLPDEALAAAVLHDVLEDTAVTYEQLEGQFGTRIAELVQELTTPSIEGNRKFRSEAEVERLRTISSDAQTIKYADILDNIKDIVANDPGFAKVYLLEKQAQVAAMGDGNTSLRGSAWAKIVEELVA